MLKEKTRELFDYVKSHGGRVSRDELIEGLGVASASITGRISSLVKNGLATYEKVTVEGCDKPVGFVELTDAGMAYNPDEDVE